MPNRLHTTTVDESLTKKNSKKCLNGKLIHEVNYK